MNRPFCANSLFGFVTILLVCQFDAISAAEVATSPNPGAEKGTSERRPEQSPPTSANRKASADVVSHSTKRLALQRDMTFGELFRRFPQLRMLRIRGLNDVDPARDASLTVEQFARRFKYGWEFEMRMCSLNNGLVLLENADRQIVGDPTLVDYDLFHGLKNLPSPETTRPAVTVVMDKNRQGLDCDGGLPYLRWVLSDGLNAVRLQQDGPPIEMLTCFQRVAGMSCEKIFAEGFLDLLMDGHRHRFDQVHVHSFGYDNHSKANPDEKSSLLMCGDRMWLNLACPGKSVQWVLDDSKMSLESWAHRQLVRHGWDTAAKCLFFTTIDDRPNRVGVRPKAYDGFTDQQIVDFIGTEWPETIQAPSPCTPNAGWPSGQTPRRSTAAKSERGIRFPPRAAAA